MVEIKPQKWKSIHVSDQRFMFYVNIWSYYTFILYYTKVNYLEFNMIIKSIFCDIQYPLSFKFMTWHDTTREAHPSMYIMKNMCPGWINNVHRWWALSYQVLIWIQPGHPLSFICIEQWALSGYYESTWLKVYKIQSISISAPITSS
jgi:hypothetical protein